MEIKRCYDTIVGASVGENQLVRNGDFSDGTTGWSGTATISASDNVLSVTQSEISHVLQSINVIANHKYFGTADVKATDGRITFNGILPSVTATGTWQTNQAITNASASGLEYLVFSNKDATYPSTWQMRRVMWIDLTAELGSTIADYIYSLEQATAGAGVAWVRKYIDIDTYHPYDVGTLKSVEGLVSHDMVGFNQWDEEWEVGGYNISTGEPSPDSDRIRTKNYIHVFPNTQYYVKTGDSGQTSWQLTLFYYDAEKNFVSVAYRRNGTIDIPANVHFVRFMTTSGYGTNYNHDICINLSSDRNGEYEPYTSQTYDYGDDVLNGIFKLDANNNLYADGDRKTSDGVITRKYKKIVIDEDADILTGASGMPFRFKITDKKQTTSTSDLPNAIADKLQVVTQASTWGIPFTFSFTLNQEFMYFKLSDSITTIEDAKTWLASNPITLVYELATPTTETSTPFQSPQVCYPDGTEEYVTSNGVPVGHETRYEL